MTDTPAVPEPAAPEAVADSGGYGEIRAVVTRADGTVVDLGVIAARYKGPKAVAWSLWGDRRAQRRIRQFNAQNARLARADS